MGLSDAEIETRLAALRRQREALDREIADLILYQELGRRLGAVRAGAERHDRDPGSDAALRSVPEPDAPPAPSPRPAPDRADAARRIGPTGSPAARRPEARAAPGAIPPAIPFTEDAAGARRYGRALVEAACGAIARAGRPLHAAEILDVLSDQGFTLPGGNPVAALNTRLWKRSGPGGPLQRVGEAVYALGTDAPPA